MNRTFFCRHKPGNSLHRTDKTLRKNKKHREFGQVDEKIGVDTM